MPVTQPLPIRVGVEFLPPTNPREAPTAYTATSRSWPRLGDARPVSGVVATPDRSSYRPRSWEVPSDEPASEELPWNLDRDELFTIENQLERVSVHLMQEMMGDDRRRFRRELGTPILEERHRDLSYLDLPNYMSEWDTDYEQMLFSKRGSRLFRRPIRKAIKSFTLFHDMDLALEAIKEDLPGDYEEENESSRLRWGRLTARLRSNFDDPLELAYKNVGFRIGSSQAKFKAGYSARVIEDFVVSLRTEYEYDSDDFAVRADFTYIIDDRTSAHLTAGDAIKFGSNANNYSLMRGEEPDERSTGLLFYVEHLF